MLDLLPTEVVYVSRDIEFINNAMEFLSGTIWITRNISYEDASRIADMVSRDLPTLNDDLNGGIKVKNNQSYHCRRYKRQRPSRFPFCRGGSLLFRSFLFHNLPPYLFNRLSGFAYSLAIASSIIFCELSQAVDIRSASLGFCHGSRNPPFC